MTSDSATNYSLAYSALRTRLVREDRHRFALPGEPEPGYTRRRARAQNAALTVAEMLGWSVVVPSIVVGVMFAVFGGARCWWAARRDGDGT